MATTSNLGSDNKNLNKNSDIPYSVFHKAVCLEDWWLIKTEKDFNGRRRLAIGGLEVREQRAGPVRVFSSSPIIKRYDLFTLETADGITVMINGFINKSRTEENGFTSEVCGQFLIGFPYYWETYADQCFGKESTTRGGHKHEHEEDHLHATNKKTKAIPNKQEKLTPCPESEEQQKLCFQVQPENATHGTPTMHVNAEIVNSSDVVRSCTDGTDTNDSTRDVSASIQTDLTNVYPRVVKITASVDISSDNLTRIPKTQEKVEEETSGSSTGKRTNLHSISRSQDYEAVIGIPVEEKLGQGKSFGIVGVVDGIEGTLEQSSSTKPDVVSPKISERGENSENRPCVENKNNEPISTLETLHKPSGHHLVGNCVSSVCRKLDSSEEIVNPSEARRSSIRVKNLRSRYKEDKTSNNRIESERNKIVSVSKGCDMKSNVDDIDSGLRRICDLDQLNIGLGVTAPGLTKADVDDKSSRNVSQMNCMLSSVSRLSTGALRNLSCGSAYDFPEASTENEPCRTPMRLDDTKCTSDLKMSPGQEQSNNKKQKKLGRKKRNVVPLPPVTRSTEKDLSFVSPESLSLGRSRAGRLLVRPLPFWLNQHPVYGVDGRITGIFTGYQDDPSHLGSSSGSRSEPPKKKRKLT